MNPVQYLRAAIAVFVPALFVACAPRTAPRVDALPHPGGRVLVSWAAADPDADGVVIQRRTAGEDWQVIAEPTTPPASFVDDPGAEPRFYSYRIATLHGGRRSSWSRPATSVPTFEGKPFVGWLNVAEYATCDLPGVPRAHPIQCALADLGGRVEDHTAAEGPHVVFLPDGEYEVDRTLFLEGRGGVQLVGESAGGVVVRWTGPRGNGPDDTAVLFHAEGNRDATFRNIVWDAGCERPGEDCFVVAFDQSFCGRPGGRVFRANDCGGLDWPEDPRIGVADNGGAHFDSSFVNAYVGLRLGHHGVADDTATLRRCNFSRSFAGVSLEDFNALHHWFWDPTFEDNHVGITNDLPGVRRAFDREYRPGRCGEGPGAPSCFDSGDCTPGVRCVDGAPWGGDFAIYRGRFSRNRDSDVWAQPTGEFIVRDSHSAGSGRFFYGAGPNASRASFTLMGNRVHVARGPAIVARTPGPFLLVDNEIVTAGGGPAVRMDSLVGRDAAGPDSGAIDLVAVDNGYSSPQPYALESTHRLREVGRGRVPLSGPRVTPPAPRSEDPLEGRPVYTVTDARSDDGVANARRIQQIVDAAAADPRPAVVHFPSAGGRYPIAETLRIPEGADLLLVGDGAFTTLWWIGAEGQPALGIDAGTVTRLTVRDLQFLRGGIVVENLDAQDAPVLASQLRLDENGVAGTVVQEVDRVRVDLVDYKAGFGLLGTSGDAVGTLLDVGREAAPDAGVAVWSADTGRNEADYLVLNDRAGARLLINGNYMEKSRRHLKIVGRGDAGRVTVLGGKLAPEVPLGETADLPRATATVEVEDFAGRLDLLQSQMFVVTPDQAPESHRGAVSHGARVRVHGDAGTAADVAAIGLAVRRQPTPGREADAKADAPEFDLVGASGRQSRYLRLAGKRSARHALPLPDLLVAPEASQRTIGPVLDPAVSRRLADSLELARAFEPPGFYDEPGNPLPPAIAFDKVFVFKAPVALVLAGGTPCDDAGDCRGSDVCDREGIPASVPGRCRSSASTP